MAGAVNNVWKEAERRAAAIFGTCRRALSGGNSNSGGRDDCKHPRLYIECKYTARSAVWALWRSCFVHTRREPLLLKRRPILALFEKGKEGALLVVHQKDILAVALEYLYAQSPDSPLIPPLREHLIKCDSLEALRNQKQSGTPRT